MIGSDCLADFLQMIRLTVSDHHKSDFEEKGQIEKNQFIGDIQI